MITCVIDSSEAIGLHLLTAGEHTQADVEACLASIYELDALYTGELTPALIVLAEGADEKAWPSWLAAVTRRPTNPMLVIVIVGTPALRAVNAATWLISASHSIFPAGSVEQAVKWVEGRRRKTLPQIQELLTRARDLAAPAKPDDSGSLEQ